jgi:hypothetical protein
MGRGVGDTGAAVEAGAVTVAGDTADEATTALFSRLAFFFMTKLLVTNEPPERLVSRIEPRRFR